MGGFKKFLLRGNVVDLAVAVVIGAAFTGVVNAVVGAFITPLVGLVTPGGEDGGFASAAFRVGGEEFAYGQLVDALLSFVLTAAVVYFLVVRPVQRLLDHFKTEPEPSDPVKACPECLSKIPEAARRCAFCTSEQPPLTAATG